MPIFFDFVLGKLRYGSKTPAGASIASTKTGTFTNADLVGGKYTYSHNMGREVSITVFDPSGFIDASVGVEHTDNNTAVIDFGGLIGAGTWTVMATG